MSLQMNGIKKRTKKSNRITHPQMLNPEKFRGKFRTTSHRLTGFDYASDGAYFITIVTKNHEHFFGEIVNDKMVLNESGKIAENFWREIPQHFPYVNLDEFVIMPNHIHGILWIDNDQRPAPVETLHATSLQQTNERNKTHGKNQKMAQISPKRGSLATIVRSYKSAVTKNSRQITPNFAWQRNYHDRIIRNDDELNRIREYIIYNPQMWQRDRNNQGLWL